MKAIERIDIKNYSFSKFKINNEFILNTITMYTTHSNTFIIDFDGELYDELLLKLNPKYENKFKSMPRFQVDYKYSLVKYNFFNSYFNREREIFSE